MTLRPAQLAVYDRETGQTDVKDVDIRKYVDWKSGEFIFSDDCLEEIMKKSRYGTIVRWCLQTEV